MIIAMIGLFYCCSLLDCLLDEVRTMLYGTVLNPRVFCGLFCEEEKESTM